MRLSRFGALSSVFISLLLGCWLLLQAFPLEAEKPIKKTSQIIKTKPTNVKKTLDPAINSPSAIVLPAPPPPAKPVAKTALPKAKPAVKPTPKPPLNAKAKIASNAQVKPMVAPEKKQRLSQKVKNTSKSSAKPKTPTVNIASVSKKGLLEGRALLRILEHGAGPLIEIAWPKSLRQRHQLYSRFTRCFGMRTALVEPQVGLYVDEGPRQQKWEINLDRYSGFLRQPSGGITDDEQEKIDHIRRYHGNLRQSDPVRLFPRNVDALLLGGLGQLIGPAYKQAKQIRASYRLRGSQTLVESIKVDGRDILGTIDLSGAGRGCSRRV